SNSSNTLTLSVLPSDQLNKDENTKLATELVVEESQAAIGSLTGTWTDAAGNHYTFADDGTFACSTVIKGAAL
ncbi:sodium:alanine symporter family protein, partial [Coprococcus eutactus]|nr:sodium:alanine symporter family protein [Coprococcus eutactus]